MRFPRTCLLRKMSSFRRQWCTMSSATEIWSSDDDSSSFRSCLFLFLFLLIVDTIQRQKFRAAEHTHTHTHIYIHSLWTLALLPPTMINLLFCSNISLSIPRMCNNVLLLFSFICCYSNCKESNRVCIYLRCAMNVSLENEWLFHRYKPVGYIHSCHHTFIYTFYWRE
jgi:hypothetical protein